MIDVREVLDEFSQVVKLKTTTQAIVNFKPVLTTVLKDIKAVVQVAEDKVLQVSGLDMSKSYYTIHISNSENVSLKINDLIEYKNKNFKVVKLRDDTDYGFTRGVMEVIL